MAPDKLSRDIKHSLNDWHKDAPKSSPISYLYIYRQAKAEGHLNTRQATNHVILLALKELKERHEDEAKIIERRFLDSLSARELAYELNIAESTVFPMQRNAIQHLVEVVEEMENRFNH